jgi:prevent-host-death family protein
MLSSIISSTELRRRPGAARKAAKSGVVFITERGRPAFALLSVAGYEQIMLTAAFAVDTPKSEKPYSVQRLKTSEPLVPPKPNEFDSA